MSHTRILALAVIAAAALVGCGGASPPAGIVNEARDGSGAPRDYIVKSLDPIYSKSAPRVVSYPTGRDTDEVSETGAAQVRPCSLVSREKASAILGGAVRATEEPRGPTCVYSMQGSARQMTLVIEHTRLASLRGHARKASRVRVAGRVGWCLRYESTSVAVPLDDGRVLHVTGPCAAAQRFAARALPRVPR